MGRSVIFAGLRVTRTTVPVFLLVAGGAPGDSSLAITSLRAEEEDYLLPATEPPSQEQQELHTRMYMLARLWKVKVGMLPRRDLASLAGGGRGTGRFLQPGAYVRGQWERRGGAAAPHLYL